MNGTKQQPRLITKGVTGWVSIKIDTQQMKASFAARNIMR